MHAIQAGKRNVIQMSVSTVGTHHEAQLSQCQVGSAQAIRLFALARKPSLTHKWKVPHMRLQRRHGIRPRAEQWNLGRQIAQQERQKLTWLLGA